MNATLKFTFEKETKGAVRYQEVGDDGAPAFAPQIGTLYIRKTAMPGGYPINVINNVRNVSEVATIYCATSNPVQVIAAKAETSRSVIGTACNRKRGRQAERVKAVERPRIQKMTTTCCFATRRPCAEGPSVERTSDNLTSVLSAAGTRRRSRGSRQA